MKAKRILTAAATVALVITSVFAGGNLTEVQAKDNDTPKKITLGYWESPNGELLTKEKGSLEAAFPDTDVEWVEFQSGTDILTAMQSGSIDFATIGTPPAALGLAKGYPFKIFYLHDVIGESEGLVVKKESGISSVKDLKGKKIATTFASTSHFSLLSALEAEGLSETDVTLYDMSAPDMYASWQRGEIDGAYVWEPVKSKLLDNGGAEIVSSEKMAEKGALTAEVGIVSNSFYEKYPDVVKKYIDILDESVKSYRDDGKGAAKLMSGGLNLSEEETLTTMDEIIVKDKSEQAEYLGKNGELAEVLKKTADFLYDQKSLDKKADEKIFDHGILSELYEGKQS